MADASTHPSELAPIATRVVFEDERVRVWEQIIEPGAATGPHHHELPYALVTIEGSELDVLPVPGHPAVHGTDPISVSMQDQSALIVPGGAVEDAQNTGDRTYRAILVEFKQG